MSGRIDMNCYPYVVRTNSKFSVFWIVDYRTNERVSGQFTTDKLAWDRAHEMADELEQEIRA